MQRNETEKSKLSEIEISNRELAEASTSTRDLCIMLNTLDCSEVEDRG